MQTPQEKKEKKMIVLMDSAVAYEVSLQTLYQRNRGEIIYQNRQKGLILLKDGFQELKIDITAPTKHTAEILISTTMDNGILKKIISFIKHKEHRFLHY